ncbi:hypothetical protein llap_7153 [Limosa lapponica baueri]|uniref:Uncharacterized protein n=1 Tax=Limosa lapponica baueri TaxID=1758121 RepID=A0A2I0U902_LIMLA|nr:hypothetical protein llap_7153 [Limosa lapponica baueri]
MARCKKPFLRCCKQHAFRLTKNFLACLLGAGWGELISAPVATKPEVSVKEAAAKEFLSSLRRQRRQLWDRSQPDVQQWYQQFLYLGFDEAVLSDKPLATFKDFLASSSIKLNTNKSLGLAQSITLIKALFCRL